MRPQPGRACQLSPIARKQRALAGFGFLGVGAPNIPIGQGAGRGAESGAVSGASLGTTIMPGIGTAIGAVVGAIAGAIAGAIGKQDPEVQNFQQAVAIWQQNPDALYKLANKYLVLAGVYDLTPQQAGQIRIYKKYGRMGEEPFTRDLANLIYSAAQRGVITPADSAVSAYQKVVLPWEDTWGFGPEPPNPHSDFMDRLITGLIFDYVTGYGPGHWFSRSGPLPASFSSIPAFAFPNNVGGTAPTSPTVASSSVSNTAPSIPPFPGWSSAALPGDTRLTVPWVETENGYTTTLSPAGGNNLYTTTYPDGPAQFQWALAGNQVIGLRKSPNGWGKYTGTIGPDGVSVSGSVTMTTSDHPTGWTYPFNAAIQAPAVAATPIVQAPPTSTTTAVTPVLPPVTTPPTTSAPTSTAVTVPAGFVLVGVANGLQAYVGPDGLYYSWSGTQMTPLTGVLTSASGAVGNVVSGQVQAPPSVSTAQNTLPPTYIPSPVYIPPSVYTPPDNTPVATARDTSRPPDTVATATGVPTWAWLGLGAGALYLAMGRRR